MPCLRHQIPAVLFLMGLGFQLNAQNLESTNLTSLGRFWRAIESGTRPVTIVAFGDSLQADYRSVGTWLFPRMQGEWGRAGTACFDPWGPLVTKSTNVVTAPFGTNWWHYHNPIGPEAYVYWHESDGLEHHGNQPAGLPAMATDQPTGILFPNAILPTELATSGSLRHRRIPGIAGVAAELRPRAGRQRRRGVQPEESQPHATGVELAVASDAR
jgi:hypothetical protein